MTAEDAIHLMKVAGFQVVDLEVLQNQYWPHVPEYTKLREENPWFLFLTELGPIKFGPRKRVFALHWERTKFRGLIGTDNTTKDPTMIHAWSQRDLLKYLMELRERLQVLHTIPQA